VNPPSFFLKYKLVWQLAMFLTPRDRFKLILLGVSQLALAILDLIGLLAIGAVSTLSLNLISGSSPSPNIQQILDLGLFQELSFEKVIILLSSLSAVLLVSKTVISAILSRKIVGFLALREAQFSSNYFKSLVTSSPQLILAKTPQYIYGVASAGANSSFTVSLSQFVNLIVEGLSIVLLFVGLSFVDATITVPTLLFFGLSGYITSRLLSKTFRKTGRDNFLLGVSANEFIVNASSTIRDIHVANQELRVSDKFTTIRIANYSAAKSRAFAALLPKYVAEITLVLGSLFVAGTQILIKDMRSAIAGLVVFLAMGSRMAPAILRIQNAVMEIQAAEYPSKNFIEEYGSAESEQKKFSGNVPISHSEKFVPSITLRDVSAGYADSDDLVLRSINLEINERDFVAIVGPSGAGKTTLVDLILGILPPQEGSIRISNAEPNQTISSFPNEIRYVPQDIFLLSASIAENLAWPCDFEAHDEIRMKKILEMVELSDWFKTQPKGLHTILENSGIALSGGQRQRLGIARALFSKPQLLVLDEATSSLDSETERVITDTILNDMKDLTRVVIAHRLSTVQNANRIFYVNNQQVTEISNLDTLNFNGDDLGIS